MCLILLAWQAHPGYPLVLAANRDEFHRRPTAAAQWWPAPVLLAGRDLEAGGTWLGVTHTGRWTALTNYRDPGRHRDHVRSRGELAVQWLQHPESIDEALARLMREHGARAARPSSSSIAKGEPSSQSGAGMQPVANSIAVSSAFASRAINTMDRNRRVA